MLDIEYSFDHVGIAVNSIDEGAHFYQALGYESFEQEEVPSEQVKVAFFELKNESRIELLEPTSKDSPVAKFLEKRGPGIHHICLRVADIGQAVARLKEQKVRLINEVPRKGAHNCQVVFVHPKSAGGVLIELSQPGGES